MVDFFESLKQQLSSFQTLIFTDSPRGPAWSVRARSWWLLHGLSASAMCKLLTFHDPPIGLIKQTEPGAVPSCDLKIPDSLVMGLSCDSRRVRRVTYKLYILELKFRNGTQGSLSCLMKKTQTQNLWCSLWVSLASDLKYLSCYIAICFIYLFPSINCWFLKCRYQV